ncbi:MAG: hypothetical protein ACE5LA_02745 [Dehalococcoidales bacterium]
MKNLTKWLTQPICIWCCGGLGDALLIVGIVTAAIRLSVGGFAPIYWFVLAFACYFGMIWVVLMRILVRLESKAEV